MQLSTNPFISKTKYILLVISFTLLSFYVSEYLSTNGLYTNTISNPLITATMFSSNLGVVPKNLHYNHPEHLPLNPYIALLLSHYGKYVPIYGTGYGIYAYNAVNNYHNNKPFGSYKVNENQ